MNIKAILGVGITTALLAMAGPVLAKDVGDPGRLPRIDKDRDKPAPPAPVAKLSAAEEDDRDPGHAIVTNEKLRDSIRRR